MPIPAYLAALALLTVLLIPAPSQAGAMYAVTQLPDNFHPSDINNAGQMAGAIYFNESSTHTSIFTNGAVTDLGTFGGTYSYAVAINDAGGLTGNFGPMGDEHAFQFRNGVMRDIGAGTSWGMNEGGDVVGRASYGETSTGFLYHQGTVALLGHLGNGNSSAAYAINDTGQVTGESNLGLNAEHSHPFLYDDGTLTDLGTLSGQGVNRAAAINNAGQIAGYSDAGNGRMHVFFYERGVMADLGSFGGLDVTIGGMNQSGQVVGTGNTFNGLDVAFISRDGALVDLNTLIDPAPGWSMTSALDINDHGQIVGYACRENACHAVRLDLASAVPEPGGGALLLPGVLLLSGVQRWCRYRRKKIRRPLRVRRILSMLRRWNYASRPARLRSFSFR